MRSYVFYFILIALTCSTAHVAIANPAYPMVAARKMDATIKVEGMVCGGCEKTLQKELAKMNGVLRVEASHRKKTAFVTFDTNQITLDQIEKKIEDLGFKVIRN